MSFGHRPGSGRPTFASLPAALAAAAIMLVALSGPASAHIGQAGLHDPFVAPRWGTPSTTIRFAVSFQGGGDAASAQVEVVIDGVPHAMNRALGERFGGGSRFRYSTTLPTGTHAIAFTGQDPKVDDSLDAGTVQIGAGGDAATPSPTPSPTPGPTPISNPGGDTPTGGTDGTGGGATPTATPSAPPDSGTGTSPSPTAGTGGGSGGSSSGGSSGGDSAAPTPKPTGSAGGDHGAGSSTGTPTGGGQANHTDAPGAADHTTSGAGSGSAVPTDGPVATAPGAAAPSATVPPIDDPNGSEVASAIGDPSGGAAGSGGGTGGDRGGSPADDRTIELLSGGGSISPTERMVFTAISATATTTVAMAFLLFGKRRRDDEPPAPDEVLSVNAGRMSLTPASALASGELEQGGRAVDESTMPRWRRPSLLEQRKADPRRSATATHAAMSFHHGAVVADTGLELRLIRYRAVTLLDTPDELRGTEIGYLDEGDEVQLVERSGGYWLVVCPNGSRGWLHRMTLGDVVVDERGGHTAAAWRSENRIGDGAAGSATGDPAGDDPDDGLDGGGSFGAYLRHHRR